MANGRSKGGKGDSGQDSERFVALPWSVLDCPRLCPLLSAPTLLLEVARRAVVLVRGDAEREHGTSHRANKG